MIVEDSWALQIRLIELLGEIAGVEIVGTAAQEAEALALYDARQPDAAVLDIRLQQGDGITVLEYIKSRNRQCFVVMLTNHTHAEFRRRCEQAGVNHFFEKFREFDRVGSVFRNLLRQRPGGGE